jgi:hypothetical protein
MSFFGTASLTSTRILTVSAGSAMDLAVGSAAPLRFKSAFLQSRLTSRSQPFFPLLTTPHLPRKGFLFFCPALRTALSSSEGRP